MGSFAKGLINYHLAIPPSHPPPPPPPRVTLCSSEIAFKQFLHRNYMTPAVTSLKQVVANYIKYFQDKNKYIFTISVKKANI